MTRSGSGETATGSRDLVLHAGRGVRDFHYYAPRGGEPGRAGKAVWACGAVLRSLATLVSSSYLNYGY